MRRCALAVTLALLVAGALAGTAAAASNPRCCVPTTGGPGTLPFTGLPLYVPVLASIGLIGAGVVLRRRTRAELESS